MAERCKNRNMMKKEQKSENYSDQEEQKFREFLKRTEDPKNNEGVNYALPENPTPLQVAKFKLCKKMLVYQQKNNVSDEEIANKINLSVPEVEDILFCCIEKFTLDRLVDYASKLLPPTEVNIVVESKKTNKIFHAETI